MTCGHACANSYFRSGVNNGNWKGFDYRALCFAHHGCACLYCGEINVVEAHHMDENRKNNVPENLVPLCPTHHRYMHTIYRALVLPCIEKHLKNWKKNIAKPLRKE